MPRRSYLKWKKNFNVNHRLLHLCTMPLQIASLNSGSNGNCYYIGNDKEAILVDAGISCRETVKRMKRIGLNIENVKAIFISHEHGDHISGVETLSSRFQLPVYITPGTHSNSRLQIHRDFLKHFKPHETIRIGNLAITGFPKYHDAADPHSFIITGKGITIGVFTDIGNACEQVKKHFSRCNAAFLEANYDDDMLMNGKYPFHLKKRISGDNGHLSNEQALALFTRYKPVHMSHLLLSHLSKENNCEIKTLELFNSKAGKTEILVASRYHESAVYSISGLNDNNNKIGKKPLQLNLFAEPSI